MTVRDGGLVERPCDVCGTPFDAKRPSSRYCSGACRKRAQRIGVAEPKSTATRPTGVEGPGVLATTIADLRAADRLNTVNGQVAVKLARLIDNSTMPLGVAGLTKELDRVLEKALTGKGTGDGDDGDPLDELEQRRQEKTGS